MHCSIADKPHFRREDRLQNGVVFSTMYIVCGDHEHQVYNAPHALVIETFHGPSNQSLVKWSDKVAAKQDEKILKRKRGAATRRYG